MGDDFISGGDAIEKLVKNTTHCLYVSENDWRFLMSIFRSEYVYFISKRKAINRSRRNNATVKRYAHGRTQRTRRCR